MNLKKINKLTAVAIVSTMLLMQAPNVAVLATNDLKSTEVTTIVNQGGDIISNIFPDKNLAKLVADMFYFDVDQFIEFEQLHNYDEPLYFMNRSIKSLEGVQHFRNVTQVIIDSNEISNLSPLRDLVNISYLSMGDNIIIDLSPLSNLVNLETVFARHNKISNLTPLSKLGNLSTLALESNQISDVSPLGNLENLDRLGLSSNKISDVRPLRNLELSLLWLTNQEIELKEVSVFEVEKLNIFNVDGSFPTFNVLPNLGIVSRGNLLVWRTPGEHTVEWTSVYNGFTFSGLAHQHVLPR